MKILFFCRLMRFDANDCPTKFRLNERTLITSGKKKKAHTITLSSLIPASVLHHKRCFSTCTQIELKLFCVSVVRVSFFTLGQTFFFSVGRCVYSFPHRCYTAYKSTQSMLAWIKSNTHSVCFFLCLSLRFGWLKRSFGVNWKRMNWHMRNAPTNGRNIELSNCFCCHICNHNGKPKRKAIRVHSKKGMSLAKFTRITCGIPLSVWFRLWHFFSPHCCCWWCYFNLQVNYSLSFYLHFTCAPVFRAVFLQISLFQSNFCG